MSRYKAYPGYKSSGVDTLGAIPCAWAVMQLKRSVLDCVNGIWGSEPENDGNDTTVIRVADFDRPRLSIVDDGFTYRKIDSKEKRSRLLNRGDLLLEKSGGGEKTLVGQVVLFDKDFAAVTSNFVAKMTPHPSFSGSYLNYVFSRFYSSNINYCSIKQYTGIQNLDSASYLSEKFGFPPLPEQEKIASFLDHETAKIDALIEKQQRLIELLKEKRQADISHAVTKGLNPKAPMKDSGVEWLGEVPAHWMSTRLKYLKGLEPNSFVDGPFGSNLKSEHFIEEGVVYVIESTFATTGHLDTAQLKKISLQHYETIKRSTAKGGDIIIAKIGARYGSASILPELDSKAVVSGNSLKLTVNESLLTNEFANELLRVLKANDAMDDGVNITAQPALSLGGLNNLPFLRIPLSEQHGIVKFVKEQKEIFDGLIEKAALFIELSIDVASRMIIRTFCKQMRMRSVPVFHGPHWGFALERRLG